MFGDVCDDLVVYVVEKKALGGSYPLANRVDGMIFAQQK